MRTIEDIKNEIEECNKKVQVYFALIQKENDLLDVLELELSNHPDTPADEVVLYDADPNCKHHVVEANGGGVKCTKCQGWFCF